MADIPPAQLPKSQPTLLDVATNPNFANHKPAQAELREQMDSLMVANYFYAQVLAIPKK
jgi:hypothetical protein